MLKLWYKRPTQILFIGKPISKVNEFINLYFLKNRKSDLVRTSFLKALLKFLYKRPTQTFFIGKPISELNEDEILLKKKKCRWDNDPHKGLALWKMID